MLELRDDWGDISFSVWVMYPTPLSPFPAEMQTAKFRPANDPDGFDRAAFHRALNVELFGYLDRILAEPPERS